MWWMMAPITVRFSNDFGRVDLPCSWERLLFWRQHPLARFLNADQRILRGVPRQPGTFANCFLHDLQPVQPVAVNLTLCPLLVNPRFFEHALGPLLRFEQQSMLRNQVFGALASVLENVFGFLLGAANNLRLVAK